MSHKTHSDLELTLLTPLSRSRHFIFLFIRHAQQSHAFFFTSQHSCFDSDLTRLTQDISTLTQDLKTPNIFKLVNKSNLSKHKHHRSNILLFFFYKHTLRVHLPYNCRRALPYTFRIPLTSWGHKHKSTEFSFFFFAEHQNQIPLQLQVEKLRNVRNSND